MPSEAVAQQVNAEVVFHISKLPLEEQDELKGVASSLTREINNFNWINKGYNYDLPIRIEIFFEEYAISARYRRYTAGVMLGTQTGVQFRDTRWDFRYSREDPPRMDDNTDPFANLIKYYTWICLGVEMDGYSPLGGQAFYDKAQAIAENAMFELSYVNGWDRRREFIRELIQDSYRDIRTASFHSKAGLYYLKKDKQDVARSHLARATEILLSGSPSLIELRRYDHLIRFINITELVGALKTVGEEDIVERLAKWDSEHPELYALD